VLFIHEVHTVRGRAEDEFEAAIRDGWMPTLGAGDDARLLWYTNHAHGSGPAYTVVTVTAVRDGPAWERLALRIQKGDLRQWMRELDELRHDVEAKILVPLPWSPLPDVAFDEVPADGREHGLTLYMEGIASWAFVLMVVIITRQKPRSKAWVVLVVYTCVGYVADCLRTGGYADRLRRVCGKHPIPAARSR